jgi:hypothetical protein
MAGEEDKIRATSNIYTMLHLGMGKKKGWV